MWKKKRNRWELMDFPWMQTTLLHCDTWWVWRIKFWFLRFFWHAQTCGIFVRPAKSTAGWSENRNYWQRLNYRHCVTSTFKCIFAEFLLLPSCQEDSLKDNGPVTAAPKASIGQALMLLTFIILICSTHPSIRSHWRWKCHKCCTEGFSYTAWW